MYHPERFNQTLGETIRGIEAFTEKVYPYFLPQNPGELFEGDPKNYSPRTYEGIYRHRHKLRRGQVLLPREVRLQQKYVSELTRLREEESDSLDGLNQFTRLITSKLSAKRVTIERNWFPYRIPHKKCMQFSVWYGSNTSLHKVALEVAAAAYTDGLDPEDLAIWVNPPKHKSVPSINHAQLIVKRYPENWFTLFQQLSINLMHPDIYSLQQAPDNLYPQ